MNVCTFKIDLWNEPDLKTGTTIKSIDFVPTVGMHFGESQLLTVCQVHFMGVDQFGSKFNIHLRIQNNHSTDEIETAFPSDTLWEWETIEDEEKAPLNI